MLLNGYLKIKNMRIVKVIKDLNKLDIMILLNMK